MRNAFASVLSIVILVVGSHAAGAQESARLRASIDFGRSVPSGAVVLYFDTGSDLGDSKTIPIGAAQANMQIDVPDIKIPPKGDFLFIHGEILDGSQKPVGFIPVRAIDVWARPRQDLIDENLVAFATPGKAFEASFPFVPSFKMSLTKTSVGAALHGMKLLLVRKWIQSDIEWDRMTSDILLNLPPLISADSSKAAGALTFLDQFVQMADDEKYDGFYVNFLLRLKSAGIGGISLGQDQDLDGYIFATLQRMFSTRIRTTVFSSAETLAVFKEQSTETTSGRCVEIAGTIAYAISGAAAAGTLDLKFGTELGGEVVSFMQKMSECAQQYYVDVSGIATANRKDVEGAAKFLVQDTGGIGSECVTQFIGLFEALEPLGQFPRRPVGGGAQRRLEVAKYYEAFIASSR
ncbi:MAG: hypothetical protein ABL879_14975 [Devosia sp.]